MQHKTLLASVLVLAVIGAATLVIAQDGVPGTPQAKSGAGKTGPMVHDGMDDFMSGPDFGGPGPGFGRPGFGRMGFDASESPVIGDLTALERLYRESGRTKELPALYNDVLAKSQDPRVRTYVYHQLARVQSAPASTDQAIATLRKSLDENLSNEAKQRAELDKIRSDWEQRRGQAKPAPQS